MQDYIVIGSAPCDESCAQVGSPSYSGRMRAETAAFIRQLRRTFGKEPEGARIALKSFPHDFGTYHEVVVYFDDSIRESVNYAFRLEAETPANWDEEAREELQLGEWL